MRKLSANLILPVSSPPLKNGIITVEDDGRLSNLTDTGGNLREESGLEFYNGVIVPGFVIPWFNPGETPLVTLDKKLPRYGIKGIGLVLSVDRVSDEGLKLMSASPVIYHPVIELNPGPDEEHFEVFDRGIDLVSHAFNEYNLSCSLTAGPQARKGDMGKLLAEYASSHENVIPPEKNSAFGQNPTENPSENSQESPQENSPENPPSEQNPLDILSRLQHPRKGIDELIAAFTLDPAAALYQEDTLGSIEPGKSPGLNLIGGFNRQTLRIKGKSSLKILV